MSSKQASLSRFFKNIASENLPTKRKRNEVQSKEVKPLSERNMNTSQKRNSRSVRKQTVNYCEDSSEDEEEIEESSSSDSEISKEPAQNSSEQSEVSEEEVEEEDQDETSEPEFRNELIEFILASRKLSNGGEPYCEYLIKVKEVSYLHVEWLSEREIKERFSNGKSKLNKFLLEFPDTEEESSDELHFNPDYTIIDRIIDEDGKGKQKEFLVKWKCLSYDDATWETKEDLEELCDNFKESLEKYRLVNSKKAIERAEKVPRRYKPTDFEPTELEIPSFRLRDLTLKDYQEEGFRWLVHSWFHGRNPILADEMGLGKTIQAISIIQYLSETLEIHGPFLIVAPMSTLEQWKREVELWTNLNCITYHGSAKARDLIYQTEWFFEGIPKRSKIYKFQVLVTTYEVAMAESTKLSSVPWEYTIIDEGHRIKNQKSKLFQTLKSFNSRRKLLLTGTPLQNGIKELWTLLNYLEPNRFDDCDEFLEEYGNLSESSQVARLHKKLGPFLLRRTKEDVAINIPKKEEILVEIELTKVQKTYYKAILDKNREFLTKSTTKSSLMNIMMQLRKVCNHPFLIHGVEENIVNEKKSDPIKDMVSSSSKFSFMDKLLHRLREGKHRVLIFSQMTRLLDILEDYMNLKHYPYERLDGGVRREDRLTAIDRFCNPQMDSFVFLLGTRAGGLGINLTIADTVILFDSDWNPQNDLQAQARCHRIGQERAVKIYRLITRDTYERHMFEVASRKLGLDKVVLGKKLDEDKASMNGLSKENIEELLKYGAYKMFTKKDEADEEIDIDAILNQATKLTYSDAKELSSTLSSFSKATFCASEEDKNFDMHDKHFWEKLLPSLQSYRGLFRTLSDHETLLDTEEKRTQFWSELEKTCSNYNSSSNRSSDLLQLIKKATQTPIWSSEQQVQLHKWSQAIEHQPRLRKRNRPATIVEMEQPPVKKSKEIKEKKSKAQEKKPKVQEKPKEWLKAQRDRFRTALLQFGWGRWDKIAETAKLTGIFSTEAIQSFAENFLHFSVKYLDSPEESFFETLVTELSSDATKDVQSPKKKSKKSQATVSLDKDGPFKPGDTVNVSLPSSENMHVIIWFYKNGGDAIPVRKFTSAKESLDIIIPGFIGKYRIECLSNEHDIKKSIGKSGKFEVLVHPILETEDFLKTMGNKSSKTWNKRLSILQMLNWIQSNEHEIPSLGTKAPASWWTKSHDQKLLDAILKFGYGKYKEIQQEFGFEGKQEEEAKETEDSKSSQEEETKESKDKETKDEQSDDQFPNSSLLNKRLNKLCETICKKKKKKNVKVSDMFKEAIKKESAKQQKHEKESTDEIEEIASVSSDDDLVVPNKKRKKNNK